MVLSSAVHRSPIDLYNLYVYLIVAQCGTFLNLTNPLQKTNCHIVKDNIWMKIMTNVYFNLQVGLFKVYICDSLILLYCPNASSCGQEM